MPTLFPPEYKLRPDAPLLSFGPAFSEEIARSAIQSVCPPDQVDEVRVAAALTMLEAFHPRDQLECMYAAQGVACHTAIMDGYRDIMDPATTFAATAKKRAGVASLTRVFSLLVRDLERRQSKPLLDRPPSPDEQEPGPNAPAEAEPDVDMAADAAMRPDGTPGTLTAYAPKPVETPFIPREPFIMRALASRPKAWRLVKPGDPNAGEIGADPVPPADPPPYQRHSFAGERIYTGDALTRFTSTRVDPDAPPGSSPDAPSREPDGDESASVELEILDTGGDPEMGITAAAWAAAHPEGRPAIRIDYGPVKPARAKPSD